MSSRLSAPTLGTPTLGTPTEGRLARFMIVANPMLGRANAMVYGGAALGGLLAWLVSP